MAVNKDYYAGWFDALESGGWKYPEKGELPPKEEVETRYQVTRVDGEVGESFGMSIWMMPHLFRAWRPLTPAPKLK